MKRCFVQIFFLSTLVLICCARDLTIDPNCGILKISPNINLITKSLTDNSNIDAKEIGIQVTNSLGTALYLSEVAYSNLRLYKTSGSWIFDDGDGNIRSVNLSTENAKLYAYYPFTNSPGTINGIGENAYLKIDIASQRKEADMIDYLWASQSNNIPVGGSPISQSNAEVLLKLNHSMALMAFVIYADGYNGPGAISFLEIKDNSGNSSFKVNKSTNNDLKMNLSNGAITGGEMIAQMSVDEITSTVLPTDPGNDPATLCSIKNSYILIAPTSIVQKSNLEISFTIDGKNYSAQLSGSDQFNITAGNNYIIKVKLSPTQTFVTDVQVWNGVAIDVTSGNDPWGGLQPVTISGTIWAPRNAGYDAARKYGLLYQWHRKYGQGYNTTETPELSAIAGPVDFTTGADIANRNKSYYNGSGQCDWTTLQQASWSMALWYNPCPAGWRVPTPAELNSLISSGSTWVNSGAGGLDALPGRWFGPDHNGARVNSIFLPAAGGKSAINGTGTSRNIWGMLWSTESSGTEASTLYFDSSTRDVRSGFRATAYSIRCVKAIPGPAIINTLSVSSITHNSAVSGGIVENEGASSVSEKGVVYHTSQNPTTNNIKISIGAGIGRFTANMTGLTPSTTYYVRSYAINSGGTSYGPEYAFTTTPDWGGLEAVTIGATTWAPVNEGYIKTTRPHGLMFQWHRKYGQEYVNTGTVSGPAALDAGSIIGNSNIFYNNASGTSWTSSSPASWSMLVTYNPCPTGWKVPSDADYIALKSAGSTWVASGGPDNLPGRWVGGNHNGDHVGSLFFSAPGYRNYTDGVCYERNSNGRYWTITKSTSGANAMRVSSSTFDILENFTGAGISVRCVKQ